jgi:hypothetical protein
LLRWRQPVSTRTFEAWTSGFSATTVIRLGATAGGDCSLPHEARVLGQDGEHKPTILGKAPDAAEVPSTIDAICCAGRWMARMWAWKAMRARLHASLRRPSAIAPAA